jgi:acyl carrier protein
MHSTTKTRRRKETMKTLDGPHLEGDGPVMERLRKLIAESCLVDPAKVVSNARLLAYGVDSVRILELIVRIEEEFQIQLDPEQLFAMATVGQLARYLGKLDSAKHGAGYRTDAAFNDPRQSAGAPFPRE